MTRPFRRRQFKRLVPKAKVKEQDERRGTARERGYDADWVKARDRYMSRVAMHRCEECSRRGYLKRADVVDHMVPVSDAPDKRLDPDNFDALCHVHHNGWKRRLENYARKNGLIEMLPRWVKCPDMRPGPFQIIHHGPMKAIFDAEDQERAGP